MLMIIDNYDSFTYNLVHYFQCLKQEVLVKKNDQFTLDDIERLAPSHLIISPGPNAPEQAGLSLAVIKHFCDRIPILGICLGHQCLGAAYGASIIPAPQIVHGRTTPIHHEKQGLFHNLPTPFQATRYHSLAIDPETLPACLRADAWSDKTLMAISHRHLPLFGLQFHPEAILSEHGMTLLGNFLNDEYQCPV